MVRPRVGVELEMEWYGGVTCGPTHIGPFLVSKQQSQQGFTNTTGTRQ